MSLISTIKNIGKNKAFVKYSTNASWMVFEKLVRMFIGIFVGVFVARYLGPKNYGTLNYVISFVGVFGVISTLGMNNIVVRDLVHHKEEFNKILGTAFVLRIIGAIILILILSLVLRYTKNEEYINKLMYILAVSPAILSFNVIDLFFQSQLKLKFVAISNLISLSLSLILKLTLIYYEAPLVAFVVIMLFDSLFLSSSLLYFYKKMKYSLSFWVFDLNLAISIVKQGWPLVMAGFATMVYLKIDQVMLQQILGSEAVGQYAAAARLSEAWYFIPIAISSSVFPAIVRAKKMDKEIYFNRLRHLFSCVVWIAFVIAIPVTFLSDEIIYFLYGNAYWQAGKVLMIHIWAAIFVFLGEATTRWFVAEGFQKKLLFRTLFGAFFNVLLNIVFINKYGIMGAALATIISQFISVYIINLFDSSTFSIFKLQTLSIMAPMMYLYEILSNPPRREL